MTPLSRNEIEALQDALDDEYKALATYDQVIEDFGAIRPFINIRDSEARHISALLELFGFYDVEPPENTWIGNVPRYEDVHSACTAAVEAEIENVELYDRIMTSTARPIVVAVFRNLRDASQQRHLPAFERCAERCGRGN